MVRRPDPARLHAARRAGTLHRLAAEGMLIEDADAWVTRWELTTILDRDDPRYWADAVAWIRTGYGARRRTG